MCRRRYRQAAEDLRVDIGLQLAAFRWNTRNEIEHALSIWRKRQLSRPSSRLANAGLGDRHQWHCGIRIGIREENDLGRLARYPIRGLPQQPVERYYIL